MLIEEYDIELSTPECDLESSVYRATVRLDSDIGEVLPYVNATVEKGEFIPGIPVLVWTEGSHRYALRSNEMAISNISDRGEANRVVQALVQRVNTIWENRSGMEPDYSSYERPKVLDVLKLLPKTNCAECGKPSCMAFADSVIKGEVRLDRCPALSSPENAENRDALCDMGLE